MPPMPNLLLLLLLEMSMLTVYSNLMQLRRDSKPSGRDFIAYCIASIQSQGSGARTSSRWALIRAYRSSVQANFQNEQKRAGTTKRETTSKVEEW